MSRENRKRQRKARTHDARSAVSAQAARIVELEATVAHLLEAAAEVAERRLGAERRRADVERHAALLQDALTSLERHNSGLMQSVSTLQQQNGRLESDCARLQNEAERLRAQVGDLERRLRSAPSASSSTGVLRLDKATWGSLMKLVHPDVHALHPARLGIAHEVSKLVLSARP